MAVTVAVTVDETPTVLIVKVVELAPAGTVTVDGRVTLVLLELSATDIPPVGAEPLNVTVAVEVFPPITEVGDKAILVSVAAMTVRLAICVLEPCIAVIVSVTLLETAAVVTVNVAVVCPAVTVTEVGTVALVLLELKLTETPPVGAGPFNVIVPVDVTPPRTDVGATARLISAGGLTVSVANSEPPFSVPVMVAATAEDTAEVETVKVADLAPAAIVTVAGTVALVALALRVTVAPPGGAGPFKVTVPVAPVPPITEDGRTERPDKPADVTVSEADCVFTPWVPVMVVTVLPETAVVEMLNVAEVAPATMVTLAGAVALELLEDKLTTDPPGPAGPFRVTVPVEELPPITEFGDTVRLVRAADATVKLAV